MVQLNVKYVRRNTVTIDKTPVKPFEIEDGKVHFSHEGYFDWRQMTINLFLERYQLLSEREGKEDFSI